MRYPVARVESDMKIIEDNTTEELWKDPEKLSIKRLLAMLVLWTGAAVTFWMSAVIRAEGG